MESMRDECRALFSQHSKEVAVLERKIDKLLEKVGEAATLAAVAKSVLENHYNEMLKNGKRRDYDNEKRDKDINRNFKLALSALVVALAGGGLAGVLNYIY